ncbi:Bug family tripartite tricarboxylate transporter substrate binding protein [Verticiella sediminum]|nr:tripartite tricarboxylate transporter substrate binding protein [Verticiella sediminum]
MSINKNAYIVSSTRQPHRGLKRRDILALLACAPLVHTTALARLQSTPIRAIVPFPPGSATEIGARFIANKLAELTGQPVIVESRGGGNGFIAVQAVMSAPADGHTVLFGGYSTLVTNEVLFKKLPYDTLNDLAPVSMTISSPVVLLTSRNSPYKRLPDFITAAQRQPGKVTIGSGSASYLLAAELLAQKGKFEFTSIPYKSAPETALAVASGQIDLGVVEMTSALPHIQAGIASALAIATESRHPALPDVPTSAEAGVQDFLASFWTGIAVSARTPKETIDSLSDLMVKIMNMPETRKYFTDQNVVVMPPGQAAMRTLQGQEIAMWKKIAADAKIELQ